MTTVDWPGRHAAADQGRLVALAPQGAEIWLDGGHNPGAGLVVAEALADQEERNPRPLFLICGMINTKDPIGYFQRLQGHGPPRLYGAGRASATPACRMTNWPSAPTEAGLSAEPVEFRRQRADAAARHLGRRERRRAS